MATNSGIRISRDTLTRTLTLYKDGLPEATQAGVEAAMDAGAQAMVDRARAATTPTGRGELKSGAPRKGPGREETGAMIAEFQDGLEAGGGVYKINSTRGGNLNYTFGILDPDTLLGHSGNPYMAIQELGSSNPAGGPGSGRGSGIEPMLAVQAGFNVVASRIEQDIAVQLAALGRSAEAGKLYQRAAKQSGAK